MNIACWSEENLRCFGDYDTVVAENRTWRSTDLHEHASRLAAALVARGMTPGDRVVLLLPNGGELIAAFTGTILGGGIAVPLFAGTTAHELVRVLEQCTPFAIVAGVPNPLVEVDRAAHAAVRVATTVGRDVPAGWDAFEGLVASSDPLAEPVPRAPEDPALICYTSGTSGTPRGAVYTHAGLRARHPVVNHRPRTARPAMVVLAALPLGTMGATILTARLASKMTLVTHDGFEPRRFVDAIERHRVQATALVPSMAEALLALPELATRDLRSLRHVTIGGAPVPSDLVSRLASVLPVPPLVSYGMTEAGGGISSGVCEAGGSRTSPVSAGVAMAGVDVRICDEHGRTLAPGETGEIHVRTPWMSAGYYGQPDETASLFQDGWLCTGDLGYVDAASRLFVVGRRKELIIQGGVNLHPSEVEAVIRQLPGVAGCAVLGIPKPFLGEEVVACVVPVRKGHEGHEDVGHEGHEEHEGQQRPGSSSFHPARCPQDMDTATESQITVEQVAAACRRMLGARKAPARVLLLSELPLTAAGKVDTEELRRRAMALGRAAAPPLLAELEGAPAVARISRVRELIGDEVRRIQCADDGMRETAGPFPVDRTFAELGLDSVQIVRLCHGIGTSLGRDVSPLLAFSHPTPGALAERLASDRFDRVGPARPAAQRKTPSRDGIAIVGVGCRLPTADGPAAVWRLLDGAVDATGEIQRPGLRRGLSGSGGAPGSVTTRAALLGDPYGFDAEFFGLSRREAAVIDPQQRLLLEVTWEALEDAGWNPLSLRGTSTGVFIGLSGSDEVVLDGLGAAPSMATGRICHFFDLHGPAAVIDTACSSSLFAIHSAVRSLRNGECDVAIAGGVSLIGSSRSFIGLSRLGTLAPDGRSKPFDAQADGYGRGEGCVLFVLRPLADAEANGDRVLAVIHGSAAAHDGRSTSLTAPNGRAQEEVIRRALEDAAIDPASIDYLEAHGTGTPVGDPIEVSAAMAVLGDPARRLVIGSIKSNVGHLEAAAGAAGLLKVVLALRHERIPAHLHLRQLNPLLEPFASQFLVPTTAHPWPARRGRPRIAGVTSMGLSGTNVHVVVGDAPTTAMEPDVSGQAETPRTRLLCLSARTDAALDWQMRRYADHLDSVTAAEFADGCVTSAVGRAPLTRRAAVVAATPAGARAELLAHLEGAASTLTRGGRRDEAKMAFLFTGHGTQYAGMGRTLYEEQPVFRQALQRCAAILRPLVPQPLIAGLGLEGARDDAVSALDDIAFAQPAIVAFEWALAEAWRAWGMEPAYVAGHSIGECAAAAVAGVLSIEDALTLAAARGRLLGSIAGRGRMAAVRASAEYVERTLRAHAGRVAIAAINGPQRTVVSGAETDVEEAAAAMVADGIDVTWLAVPVASHSSVTDPILDELERVASTLTYRLLRVPLVSTLTGRVAASQELSNATYWRRQIRERVRFADAVSALLAAGCNTFVEVGPHPALLGAAQDVAGGSVEHVFVPTLSRDRGAHEQMLSSLGELFVWGLDPSWAGVFGKERRRRAALPTYPFERGEDWRMEKPAAVGPAGDSRESSRRGVPSVVPAIRRRVMAAAGADRLSLLDAWVQREFALATGHPLQDITGERSCIDLGMDSLRIVDLAARIRGALGVPCTPADILSRPTSAALSCFLDAALPANPDRSVHGNQEDAAGVDAAAPRVTRPIFRTQSPLVVLHAGGTRCPLICVHPSGGRITAYLRLRALLGDDRPLFALQSRGLADPAVEHDSIAAMAIDYSSLVESVCEPPYELLGWSMGGLIAHTMAVELERRGVAVERVTMIDARRPGRWRGTTDRAFALTAWLLEMQPALSIEKVRSALRGGDLSSATPERLLASCEDLDLLAKGSVTADVLDRDVRLYEHHFALARQFEPRPVTARVDQWWVESAPDEQSTGPFGSDVQQHIVRGTHFSVMQPPAIETIAATVAVPPREDRSGVQVSSR